MGPEGKRAEKYTTMWCEERAMNTILVIEDDDQMFSIVGKIFGDNAVLERATSAEEAREALKQGWLDRNADILMDGYFPEKVGEPAEKLGPALAAELIKGNHPRRFSGRVIGFSSQKELLAELLAAGCEKALNKSRFLPNDLLEAFRIFLIT